MISESERESQGPRESQDSLDIVESADVSNDFDDEMRVHGERQSQTNQNRVLRPLLVRLNPTRRTATKDPRLVRVEGTQDRQE